MNLCTKHSSLFSLFPSEDLRHYASSYTVTDATWTKQKSWQFNRKHWHPCICCQPVAQLQESHYFKPIEQNWKWKSNECHKRKKMTHEHQMIRHLTVPQFQLAGTIKGIKDTGWQQVYPFDRWNRTGRYSHATAMTQCTWKQTLNKH